MTRFSKSTAIKAPLQLVYEVVTDFEHYGRFLDEVQEIRVQSKTKSQAVVMFKVNYVKAVRYTLNFKLSPWDKVTWTLVDGDLMKSNEGSWKLVSLEKNLTDATFTIDVGFTMWVPKSIGDAAIKGGLPGMLAGFKAEAERRFAQKRSGPSTVPPARKKRPSARSGKK